MLQMITVHYNLNLAESRQYKQKNKNAILASCEVPQDVCSSNSLHVAYFGHTREERMWKLW